MVDRIAVLGAGAWGSALAKVLGDNQHEVRLWARDADHVQAMVIDRENRRHLPGCPLPDTIEPTADFAAAITGSDWILVATPSVAFRATIRRLAPFRPQRVAWATKGLDADSGGFLHGIVEQEITPEPQIAVLSGPTFAAEVGQGLPAAMTVAASSDDFAAQMVDAFHCERFRLYTNPDMVGVELGGAVKNVLAVATGVSDGMGLGANARAALVTRGMAEITRLGAALGADPRTLIGLAGLGDLLLTCTDDQSRNRRFGLALGRGAAIDEALEVVGSTVEGARTAAELYSLAARYAIEMPICSCVYRLVSGAIDPARAVTELMERTPKAEV
ncbi:NAD(P)-dependent glycerol-3-phosphate dehydrogenase [Halorhodospira halochloris]|uniref:Glycerol-3-phosphate dehydrogenase [NAD(P)+] n=1 Tax=Halorhodospira halochloris TaxID=1052 RepID=A0A110B6S2_HALHR|nr:NAD(P)H-dependent glycerol-3-phosphate dehydrogenase [Halorhodospira halochloris]MBK1650818.1 glycerol-3-phosphate dehydrogenase [Halorhodospira halochloris]MCG5530258.1 NAD(P)-dependent glycerol-3-phosphate dehydrogenase [Halorhodospira halochloris]MCG5547172.1 NAD(P)-dependent glycerol-3-phosphate dehydrogenase [Halorhodospira halochloris]BAU56683.1 glycerol-3-phosphate dehydrogenase [NAD(P)+] [Halorhodospira halochloris]